MSGVIALAQLGDAPVDPELLQAMTAAQRFRGPDGEGRWLSGSVGLGHTLFRAVQEAEREVQPANLDGRFVVSCDARIDARRELVAELRARDLPARADLPDPELLLHAYAAWGDDCLAHLLGDFCFALWDADRRRLLCAVDQLGVKPFYYTTRGGLFAGSNSLGPLRLHPHVRDTLNDAAVADFLLVGACQDRGATIYEDIVRIPPGHYLVVEAGRVRLHRYFTLPHPATLQPPRRTETECLEQFEALLDAAVADRLRTPRVAVYMSGGIDSPLVAQTAQRVLAREFPAHELAAFTFVYDRLIPDDERHYAGLIAQHLGVELSFVAMDDAAPFDLYRQMTPDAPTAELAAGIAREQTQELARRFRVALTGYDGDALLLCAMRRHWGHRLAHDGVLALARDVRWYVDSQHGLPPIGLRTAIARLRGKHRPSPLPRWLHDDFARRVDLQARWRRLHASPAISHPRDPAFHNLCHPGWSSLFDGFDAGALRCPLEVRHPLADLRIVEFALGLPALPWCADKELLRRCFHGAPAAFVRRPKTPLRASPSRARIREQGLGGVEAHWPAAGLNCYVHLERAQRALAGDLTQSPEFDMLCQLVGLGLWLGARERMVRSD